MRVWKGDKIHASEIAYEIRNNKMTLTDNPYVDVGINDNNLVFGRSANYIYGLIKIV